MLFTLIYLVRLYLPGQLYVTVRYFRIPLQGSPNGVLPAYTEQFKKPLHLNRHTCCLLLIDR